MRGLGAPQAIALVLFIALRRETGFGTLLAMAADLPLFCWVIRYLRRRGMTMRQTFGLVPGRQGWAPLLGTTLVLVAIGARERRPHRCGEPRGPPQDALDGRLHGRAALGGPARRALLEAVDATVWAPVVEEVLFRGLLYATLRTRLGVPESALASALVFTLPHGYALAGSASVLVSGLLWAVAYERTRSLWPGLLAHAANNLLSTLWTVGLLR